MSIEHTDVAAYSLGLLDEPDRRDFETHLAQCPECVAEQAEFASMAELFAGIGPIEDEESGPDEGAVADLFSRRAAVRKRRNRQRTWLAVAASVVLLGGGLAAGMAAVPSAQVVSTPVLTGALHQATNPNTGITGTVGLVSKPWGTQVTLRLGKVRGPLDCQLIAISKSGVQRVMIGWFVPGAGYGVPDHPADLLIEGGTSINMQNITKIDIEVVHGKTLLTIPI